MSLVLEAGSGSMSALAKLEHLRRNEDREVEIYNARVIRNVLEGRFAHHVEEILREKFAPPTFNKLLLNVGIRVSSNHLRDMLRKTCTGFSNGMTCTMHNAKGPMADGSDGMAAFGECCKELNMHSLAKDLERKTKLYSGVFVMPTVAPSERLQQRIFQWKIHTPETFWLLTHPDNPLDFYGVVLIDSVIIEERGEKIRRRRATIWTIDEWVMFVERNATSLGVGWTYQESGSNPYGIIPGVFGTGSEQIDSLWNCEAEGARWADDTIKINAWEVYRELLGALQIKVPMGSFGDDMPSGQVYLHGRPVDTGNAANPLIADLQLDLDGYTRVLIDGPRRQEAISQGLAADEFTRGSVAESGAAKKLRMEDRDREAQSRVPAITAMLSQCYDVAMRVLYVEMQRADQWPIRGITRLPPGADKMPGTSEYRCCCEPNPMAYTETEDERQKRITFDVEHNMTSLVDEFCREHPDVMREEAMQRMMEFGRMNAMVTNKAAAYLSMDGEDGQDAPEEESTTVEDISIADLISGIEKMLRANDIDTANIFRRALAAKMGVKYDGDLPEEPPAQPTERVTETPAEESANAQKANDAETPSEEASDTKPEDKEDA